jgi:hypothetical protein
MCVAPHRRSLSMLTIRRVRTSLPVQTPFRGQRSRDPRRPSHYAPPHSVLYPPCASRPPRRHAHLADGPAAMSKRQIGARGRRDMDAYADPACIAGRAPALERIACRLLAARYSWTQGPLTRRRCEGIHSTVRARFPCTSLRLTNVAGSTSCLSVASIAAYGGAAPPRQISLVARRTVDA